MSYLTEVLGSNQKREHFYCGNELLDKYFKTQATQDIKRKLAACFVWADKETGTVKGFYTLSSYSIANVLIPEPFKKKLPKSYSAIPVILLGRLAVDKKYQGKGLGKLLLIDSLKRCWHISDTIGAFAVIVDPLDKEAENFYQNFGFSLLPDSGKLFLPMKTINELFTNIP